MDRNSLYVLQRFGGGANLSFYEYQVFEWHDMFANRLDHEWIVILPQNTDASQWCEIATILMLTRF